MNKTTEKLWEFVRGDLSTPEFENWICADKSLEEIFGNEDCLELRTVDYKSSAKTCEARQKIEQYLSRLPRDCQCMTLADVDLTDMGSEKEEKAFETLDEMKAHGEPYWWLTLYKCRSCAQNWLIAQEERQNDVHCFKRITTSEAEKIQASNKWPEYFQTYEELLLIGKNSGRSVQFVDPMDSSMVYTIADLAKEKPGIAVSEIAVLLSIDKELAEEMCKKAVQQENVQIRF